MLTEPIQLGSWILCTTCGAGLVLDHEREFDRYFRGDDTWICRGCGARVDLWQALLHAVADNFTLAGAYSALGANRTAFTLNIKANETFELVFSEQGVPADATILSTNYTPQDGACMPVELHSNTPYRGLPRGRVWLFGRPFPIPDKRIEKAVVHCSVVWMKAPDEDDGWGHLLDAYRAYAEKNWRGVVIPANIAAECAMSKALYDALVRRASKEHVEDFLAKGATYAHQLKVMLPVTSALESVPPLSDVVCGLLDRLRRLRNDLAHRGKFRGPFEKRDAAEVLVAATFGFHYGRFFRRCLASPPVEEKAP